MEGLGAQEQCWAEGRWRWGWRLFCHLKFRSDPEGDVNGVDGPGPPLPRCPPWGRRGEQAPSQRAEPAAPPEEGGLGLGARPRSLQARVKPRKALAPGRPGALVDAGLVAGAGPAGQERP